MIEQLGYIGALLLAFCALPQAISSLRKGHSRGLSHAFLWSWYLGEIFLFIFVVNTIGPKGPLFYNYTLNILLLTIIIYYRYRPRA